MLAPKHWIALACVLLLLAALLALLSTRPEPPSKEGAEPLDDSPSKEDAEPLDDSPELHLRWWDPVIERYVGLFNPVRTQEPQPDLAAQLDALGYLDGYEAPGAMRGVVVHDRDRAQPGYNLYVSGHTPGAHLMEMSGEVVHRWKLSYRDACPDLVTDRTPHKHWRRARLLEGGDLLVVFEYGALVRLDRSSRPVWRRCGRYHHDVNRDAEGRIVALRSVPARLKQRGRTIEIIDDFVEQLSPEGELLAEISLLRALGRSPFAWLLRGDLLADALHTNAVVPLAGPAAERRRVFAPGQLLLSFRNIHALAALDPEREEIVWAARSSWRAQHEPVLLESGQLLLFDNLGPGEGSRVAEFDPVTLAPGWSYPREPNETFFSPVCGSQQRLANGNTLLVESTAGRALEVTPEHEIVWDFHSPHRVHSEAEERVALLMDLHRIAASDVESWLDPKPK